MTGTADDLLADLPVPRPIRWTGDGEAVELLDQTLLPEEERYLRLETGEEVAEAIRSLRIRGAPAIGVAGAMGLALEMEAARREGVAGSGLEERFRELRDLLLLTRPTGRNLGWALSRMEAAFQETEAGDPGVRVRRLREEADAVFRDEAAMCLRIGEAGLELIPEAGAGVLTHCNAGALATGGIGTATAPIYMARARGTPIRALASETRPVLQGARLTAWELGRGGVDVSVITDSMAATTMKEGRVDLVVVGADRIALNGDVANKIGTYALAVLAAHHGIPFYVAAPRSTFDPERADGRDIPIEERDEAEVRAGLGRAVVPAGARVLNPAFDVTPAHLVTALVTDRGILRPPYGPAIRALLEADGPTPPPAPGDDA